MNSTRYRSLLRTVYTAILNSRVTPSEMRLLASEFRGIRFPDELAYMLDQASNHFGVANEPDTTDDRLAEAEQLIKRNKVPRAALLNIMRSLDYFPQSPKTGIRVLLQNFFDEMSDARSLKLLDILRSSGPGDEFLAGISKR